MPEGQVSHRNAIRLGAALTRRPLLRVEAPEPRLAAQRIPARLEGDAVEGAEALGKHHLLRFASGRVLHSHLMMSGVWRLLDPRRPLPRGGLFLALHVEGAATALYRCPQARLLEPSRQVGEALTGQRAVAGIGNVYKSEARFLAGIDPWRPVGGLSPEEARRLGEIGARLLAKGVADGGVIRTCQPDGAPAFSRERTWVYGRPGRPCRRCGTPVRSRGQGNANRTTYWCPTLPAVAGGSRC